jgi:hypothetical protein
MYLKDKYRNRLRNVESDLGIQLSEIKPNIEKIVAEMQHDGYTNCILLFRP